MAEKDGRKSWGDGEPGAGADALGGGGGQVLGFEHDETLTLGRTMAGLNAYSKGVSLGLFQPTRGEVKDLAGNAYALCEKLRPEIPPGKKGWGAPPASGTRPNPQDGFDLTLWNVCLAAVPGISNWQGSNEE
jgi:hypothetical protein